MAQQLMVLDVFKQSMTASSDVLRGFGVDPYKLVMDGNEALFTNTMHCMTCITAIQVCSQLIAAFAMKCMHSADRSHGSAALAGC